MTALDVLEKVIVPLIAAFIGAILAFWYQKRLKLTEDKKAIFGALMGYRNWGTTEPDFVRAMNLVVVVFANNISVKEAFHKYLTAFDSAQYSNGQRLDAIFHLLSEMAKDIGYSDLKHNDIKNFCYQTYLPTKQEPKDKDD